MTFMSEHLPPEEPASAPAPESPESTGEVSSDDRNLALLTHILGFFTRVLGPLIIWLIKKDQSKFLDHHGKQALNFQITVLIVYAVGSLTTFLVIGCIILPAVLVVDIVFSILAALAGSRGEWYRYPLALPLLK